MRAAKSNVVLKDLAEQRDDWGEDGGGNVVWSTEDLNPDKLSWVENALAI